MATVAGMAWTDLHGDVLAQTTLPNSGGCAGIDSWFDTDESGNSTDGKPIDRSS